MTSRSSLHARLMAGLAVTLTASSVYFGYTAVQIRHLREMQTGIIDRNRTDSLLLLRMQNDLNQLALAMRDMLDFTEPYPLSAWRAQFQRIRADLEDAIAREARFAPSSRSSDQGQYLAKSMAQFWDAMERTFAQSETNEADARASVRITLQPRQAALSTAVSRLLVQNNESEEQAAAQTQQIYQGVERNLYVFFGAILAILAATSVYLLLYNRRVFDEVSALSERRSELAQQLISMQENTFRSISRELHDEFGQILTAVGAMLQRTYRRGGNLNDEQRAELREVHEIVQSTLEKVRALSQALHPVILDEVGLESAIDTYLPAFERRTGVTVQYTKSGESRPIDRDIAIQIYRVLQEALNNVVRHSRSNRAEVRLNIGEKSVRLEVADQGVGFPNLSTDGMGMVSMRERAEMVKGKIEFISGEAGGALVRLQVPLTLEGPHHASTARA